MSAIPSSYKTAARHSKQTTDILTINANKNILDATSKDFYNVLLKQFSTRPTLEKRYLDIRQEDWKLIYMLPWNTLIDSESRCFQYKFLHRILATNYFLKKIGKIEDDECSFCHNSVETLEHLFYECIHTRNLWNEIIESLLKKLLINSITLNDIFLGLLDTKYSETANTIITIAKKYIWKSRSNNKTPIFQHFETFLQNYIELEKRAFDRLDKLKLFYEKWKLVLD